MQQQKFSDSIQASSNLASSLSTKIKGFVAAFAGIAAVKKSIDFIKNSIKAAQIQANAELQLQVVLKNMGAAEGAFDEIKNKASQIQKRGIFGDKAMLAGAAEFATYMSDKDAIQVMMDTLSDYAIGMSNGNEVDAHGMVDYATNLGKIMTGSYDAMSKKGFKFTEAQKAVISGTATQSQYIEVLGKDYENMSQDMQKAIAINKVIEESWANLYGVMSNTPRGQITQLKNAWGDMMETVGQELSPSITDFFKTLKDNLPQIQTIVMGITGAFKVIIDVLNDIMNVAGKVVKYLQDHWDEIGLAFTVAAASLAVFALGLNSVWLIVIAAIAAFNGLVKVIQKMTGKSVSGLGIICAAIAMFGAVIWDTIAYVWNFIAIFVEWLVNAFKHPIRSIMILLANLLAYIYDVCADITSGFDDTATNIANAMIDAINFIIRAWNKAVGIFGFNDLKGTEFNHIESVTTSLRNLAQENRNLAEKYKTDDYINIPRMTIIGLDDAYNAGYNWGANLGKKFSDITTDFGGKLGTEFDNIEDNTADTAANTGALNDTLSATDEDLQYLRDLAERDTINKFTTAQIKVDMTNNNSIASNMDIDGVVNVLTQKLNEQLATQVEGVYA